MHTVIQRPAPSSRTQTAAAPALTNRPLSEAELARVTAAGALIAGGVGGALGGLAGGFGAVLGKK